MLSEPTVFVVDGDPFAREAVHELARGMNLACRTFAVGGELLAAYDPSRTGCLILEVTIPDTSGPQIQQRLLQCHATLPLIFLTSHADVSLAVALMRAGAFHYLQKPIRPIELMDAIHAAIALDQRRRHAQERRQRIRQALAVLSSAEREMLEMIAQGKPPPVMAVELKLSLRAIELRRSKLMRKLQIKSTNGLLHFALLASGNGKRPGVNGQDRRSLPDWLGYPVPGPPGRDHAKASMDSVALNRPHGPTIALGDRHAGYPR